MTAACAARATQDQASHAGQHSQLQAQLASAGARDAAATAQMRTLREQHRKLSAECESLYASMSTMPTAPESMRQQQLHSAFSFRTDSSYGIPDFLEALHGIIGEASAERKPRAEDLPTEEPDG